MADNLGAIANAGPAVAMLAVFALVWGGIYLLAKRRDRQKALLMLACAAVLFTNVLIWTL